MCSKKHEAADPVPAAPDCGLGMSLRWHYPDQVLAVAPLRGASQPGFPRLPANIRSAFSIVNPQSLVNLGRPDAAQPARSARV